MLNVAVEPSRTEYRPGQKSTVAVKLTDPAGKPFVGTTVLAIYDKAVEYISGGSNVPEIKAFFWKWRRTHYPQLETNLTWSCGNLVRTGEKWMNDLGVFGMLPASRERYRSVDLGDYAERAGEDAQAAGGAAAMDELAKSDVHLKDAAVGAWSRIASATKEGRAGPAPPLVQPNVRSNFADTALWVGSLATNEQGRGRSFAVDAGKSDDLESQSLGAGPGDQSRRRARPRSSPARISSSACKPRDSSSRKMKSCCRPMSIMI